MDEGDEGGFLDLGMKKAFGIAILDANFDFSLGCNTFMSNLGIHMVFYFYFCLMGLCGLLNFSFCFFFACCLDGIC